MVHIRERAGAHTHETEATCRADLVSAAKARDGASRNGASWWSATWPIGRHDWLRLGIALAAVVAGGVAIGEILTNWSALAWVVDSDQRLAESLAAGRSPSMNEVAHWGAFIADTPVKIVISISVVAFLLWKLRRWHEAAMVALPLIFEASAFIITTFIVQRPRPDVERLLDSPVNSSFPSGHVAAATVYFAIAIVVFWHTRATWARLLAVLLGVAAPLVVGWARMYQGMHFLTDVIAGVVLGTVSVVICRRILGRPPEPEHRADSDGGVVHAPERRKESVIGDDRLPAVQRGRIVNGWPRTLVAAIGAVGLGLTGACSGSGAAGDATFSDVSIGDDAAVASESALAVDLRDEGFTTFASALDVVDVTRLIDSPEFTLLVPSDEAFQSMDPQQMGDLLADPDSLLTVLRNHVIGERLTSSDIARSDSVRSMGGNDLAVTRVGTVIAIGGASLTATDLSVDNGTVHVVDEVLVP